MLSNTLSSLAARVSLTPRRGLLVGLALAPALLAAVLIGLLVYGAPGVRSTGPPPPPPPAGGGAPGGAVPGGTLLPPPSGLLVEVSGAVAHPGVYRVAKGDRASAAIAAAGGITADADPNRLPNLAARLKDGQQVTVPARATPVRAASGGTARVAPVSLNDATADQLAAIPGFTPELAAAVIEYRTEYGGFSTTRELVDVLEMSESDYTLARKYITT